MPKQQLDFSYNRYLDMISEATEPKTASAVLVLAMGQYSRKKLSLINYASIVSEVAAKLYTMFYDYGF